MMEDFACYVVVLSDSQESILVYYGRYVFLFAFLLVSIFQDGSWFSSLWCVNVMESTCVEDIRRLSK